MTFLDRKEAGKSLAKALFAFKGKTNTIVLSLARGGVPVGQEIARALNLPMDILIVRKIGAPSHPEFALGAIASGDVMVWNESALPFVNPKDLEIQMIIKKEREELKRREECYRGNLLYPDLADKTVIIVDDGLATGTTAKAAIEAVRHLGAKAIVLAIPVAAKDSVEMLQSEVDQLICLYQPVDFKAVGLWYAHFKQVSDDEVIKIMQHFS